MRAAQLFYMNWPAYQQSIPDGRSKSGEVEVQHLALGPLAACQAMHRIRKTILRILLESDVIDCTRHRYSFGTQNPRCTTQDRKTHERERTDGRAAGEGGRTGGWGRIDGTAHLQISK